MTREKDSILMAEAYKNIINENSVVEYISSLDPETLNIIAHTLALGGGLGVAKLAEIIQQKKQEKGSADAATAKIGRRLPHEITPAGQPKDPYDTGHDLSSKLKNDAAALKGQKF